MPCHIIAFFGLIVKYPWFLVARDHPTMPQFEELHQSVFREYAFDMRPLGSDVGEAEAQLRTLHDEDAVIVSQSERRGERELLQSKELLRPNNRWWRWCSLSTYTQYTLKGTPSQNNNNY